MKNVILLTVLCLTPLIHSQGSNPIGGICLGDEDCAGKPNSHCGTGMIPICKCNEGYTRSISRTNCLLIADGLDFPCEELQQCTEGRLGNFSECVTGLCKCHSSAVFVPGLESCLLAAEFIGDACNASEQCQANLGSESYCASEVCVCSVSTVPSADRSRCLYRVHHIGNPCEESAQCTFGRPGPYSACISYNGTRTCQCTAEAVEDLASHVCYKKATQVGDSCLIHEQCWGNLGNHSECTRNRCQCSEGSSASSDGTSCVPEGPGGEGGPHIKIKIQIELDINLGDKRTGSSKSATPMVTVLGVPIKSA